MTDRVECGNYADLKGLLNRSPLAPNDPFENPETRQCMAICGQVKGECLYAAKAEMADPSRPELSPDQELLIQPASRIENFLNTVANPALLAFKAKMRAYADRVNDMIGQGIEIPESFIKEYNGEEGEGEE